MTPTQLLLDGPTRRDEIEADARKAWRANPLFVAEIIRLAREDRRLDPARKVSIGDLFVVARRNLRQHGVEVVTNHNWRRAFAAWIQLACTDLDGAFTVREASSDNELPRGDV